MKYINSFAVVSLSLFASFASAKQHQTSPTDIGVVNKERILYWLEKRGELDPQQDKNRTISNYIGKPSPSQAVKLPKHSQGAVTGIKHQGKTRISSLSPTDKNTRVKVLTILVDFPDLPHDENGLVAEDTAMYYANYDKQHYQNMLFSAAGYDGPSGQVLNSAYQYYQQASGESLSFTGEVYGWVRADKNAKAYGERIGDDSDIDAPSLVKEAVEKAVTQFDIDLTEYDLTDLDDIDGDGITNEPNGIIDHVMIFHSSVGEEAGGGLLGSDAIWSHRFYVYNDQYQATDLPNSPIDLFGYTINPIDAGIGVVVHEFGHDLGLPDEYDLTNAVIGEPVASWSVMSGGSWAGSPRGSEPVMFSPYALEYLQNRYSGNWLNQLTLELNEINEQENPIIHHASATAQALNQVKVVLPAKLKSFKTPVEGKFQYYSGKGNSLNNKMEQEISIPASSEQTFLTLKAHYSIESYYDYAQVTVNGQALPSQYTQVSNPYYTDVNHFITGDSLSHADSKLPNNYLEHRFDLSEFAGQTVTLAINYVTDSYVDYYGFVADDMKISQGRKLIWQDGAEQQSMFAMAGFSRIGTYTYDTPQHYYLQLRSYHGIDSGLQKEQYSPGLLLWLASSDYANNNTSEHPGEGLILVVDADQNAIARGTSQNPANTEIQLRDASFSLYQQRQGLGDQHLAAISEFNDNVDYSFAQQPESGVKLNPFGFSFSIIDQDVDNSQVEVDLSYLAESGIAYSTDDLTVSFNILGMQLSPTDSFSWQFGNGEQSGVLNPTVTYQDYGNYEVSFNRVTELGNSVTETLALNLVEPLKVTSIEASNNASELTAAVLVSGGSGPYQYEWDLGDGTTVATANVLHQYSLSGNYAITVTVTDNNNQSGSVTTNIDVAVPLTLEADYSANYLQTSFASDVAGGYGSYSYAWDFGDGSTSSSSNPSYTYQTAGDYSVTLTVTDKNTNESVNSSLSVTVKEQQSSSGGGAFGWILLLMAGLLVRRR